MSFISPERHLSPSAEFGAKVPIFVAALTDCRPRELALTTDHSKITLLKLFIRYPGSLNWKFRLNSVIDKNTEEML
jgi:hypothetical protein